MSSLYLLDEHTLVRTGLCAALQQHGHRIVGESGDLPQMLADLPRLTPDALLLDPPGSVASGFGMLVKLRQRQPQVPCIVLTMSKHPGHVAEALRNGVAGYVLKSSTLPVLLAAIDAVVHGDRYLCEQVAGLAMEALAGRSGPDPLAALSWREREIVALAAQGRSSTAIAGMLGISTKTVDTYRSRLMKKLKLRDVTALVRWAIRNDLVDPYE